MEARRGGKRGAKTASVPIIDDDEPVVKKGRGRQKKTDTTDAAYVPIIDDDEPVVKKGRGRPKKSNTTDADEQAPETKKGKGRGAKTAAVPTSEDDEPVVKKGRGRPSKTATDKQTPEPKKGKGQGKNDAATNDAEDDTDAPTTKGGKGRGTKKDEVKQEVNGDVDQAAPTTSKRGRKKVIKVKDEAVDDDDGASDTANGSSTPTTTDKVKKEEEDAIDSDPSTATTSSAGKKSKQSKGKKGMKTEEEATKKPGVERKVVIKGRAAVDASCPIAATSHVLEEKDDDEEEDCIWDCMLNQTNIQFNNNKYYLIQLLKDDTKPVYSVWMRWGRVGANGQNSLQPCAGDLNKAKKIFTKKFSDKTKNDWEMRDCFEKVPGKYDLLKMDYSQGEDTTDAVAEAEKKSQQRKKIECQLEARVRALIELICDIKVMEEAVVEMKYDAKKAPLGKLTTEQIKAGYLALKNIDDLVQSANFSNMDLVHACNDFYTRIPHYFGMKVPPLIRNRVEIQEKMSLLEALGDIQAALSVLDMPFDANVHPADQQYRSLKCELSVLEKNAPDFKILEKYLHTTHAKTHNYYTLELLDVFTCRKENEHQRFKDVGNRQLLWHGSRMSNWAGILSTGLRIAPPEAPSTGYMFGKGIYFADMASKSANYCWASHNNTVGFLLLCEVSLGKTNDLLQANYNANKLPSGCHSVKGCGRTVPLPKNCTKLSDGTVVPMGPGSSISKSQNYALLYNEYIVYDPAQVLSRYLLKVKFNFK